MSSDVLRIGTLFALFLILPLGAISLQIYRIKESKLKELGATLRLFLAAALVLILQIVLISGTVQTRQLLFAPICFYWLANFTILPAVIELKHLNRLAVPTVISVLAIIFAFAALQNFRDPFDSNPRQGGMGRYEEDQLWTLALSKALGECQDMQPDDIVIISQKEEIWVDSPVVIRCKFITQ